MNENPYASPENLDDQPKQPKKPKFSWLNVLMVLGAIMVFFFVFALPARRSARSAARRAWCMNNLKQVALALSNDESTHGSLPPAYTVDSKGKPLHSWRTMILPYLDQEELHKSIDLTKSWDDPVNAKARQAEVSVYRCPATDGPMHHTTSMASIAPEGCFRLKEPRKLAEITDNHGETIAVIEVASDHAVHWMAPIDAGEALVLGRVNELDKLAHPGGSLAAMVDASVHFLKASMRPADLRALISIGGNERFQDFP